MKPTSVSFYQLIRTPLEKALPALLDKAYSSGLRCSVLVDNEEHLKSLDQCLWTYSPGTFLPHGITGQAKEHPIWLSLSPENANDAEVMVITTGALMPEAPFQRLIDIFDGNDPETLVSAHHRKKVYEDAGLTITYFEQTLAGAWQRAVL